MRRFLGIALVLVMDVAASGCVGGGCTAELLYGLNVHVVFQGVLVCDATVVAYDGDYRETLWPSGGGPNCAYSGAPERGGTYLITATRGSLMAATNVTVREDECHVEPEQVFIVLEYPGGIMPVDAGVDAPGADAP